MELDAAVSLVLGKQDETNKQLRKLGLPLPIHKPVMGSVQFGSPAPSIAILEVTARPQAGRVWNVLSVSLFGSDAHTPLENITFTNDGSATAPAANANISGAITPSPGSYIANWIVSLIGGAPAAPADANNFKLILNGVAKISNSQNPAAIGTYTQLAVPFVADGVNTSHVNTVGAGTAGVVYSAQITAIPQFGPGTLPQTFADIYAGALSSNDPATAQVFTDVIFSAAAIPSVNFVPRQAVWMHELETIYAVIYSPPANSQVIITARVAEYPVEAVEALGA